MFNTNEQSEQASSQPNIRHILKSFRKNIIPKTAYTKSREREKNNKQHAVANVTNETGEKKVMCIVTHKHS